jgi:hypothetical protein
VGRGKRVLEAPAFEGELQCEEKLGGRGQLWLSFYGTKVLPLLGCKIRKVC